MPNRSRAPRRGLLIAVIGSLFLMAGGIGALGAAPAFALGNPTVTLQGAPGQSNPSSGAIINVSATFSEPVTGFDSSDVYVSGSAGATSASVTGSGASYNIAIGGMTQTGDVEVSVPGGAAISVATDSPSDPGGPVIADWIAPPPPTVVIQAAPGQANPSSGAVIDISATFSEPVLGFSDADVSLSGNAGAQTVSVGGNGANYLIEVSGMTQTGSVTVQVVAGAAKSVSSGLASSASNVISASWIAPPAPTVSLQFAPGQANPSSGPVITISATFSEPVVGFDASDVSLSGPTGAHAITVTGSGANYTIAITGMTQTGLVTLQVVGGAARSVSSGLLSTASNSGAAAWILDETRPTVTIDQAVNQVDPTSDGAILFTVVFSEPVTNFDALDVALTGTAAAGTVATLSGSGPIYTVSVTGMSVPGTVIATVPDAAAVDLAGNASEPSTSTDHTVTWDPAAPVSNRLVNRTVTTGSAGSSGSGGSSSTGAASTVTAGSTRTLAATGSTVGEASSTGVALLGGGLLLLALARRRPRASRRGDL